MGRFLLCGREAALPYQVEEMDLRLYSVEELCCFIYDNLSLIDDGFVDRRLLGFIREELGENTDGSCISVCADEPIRHLRRTELI